MIRAISLVVLLALPLPAAAQPVADDGLTRTIEAQLNAFRADDFPAAFAFASETIKRVFGTVERFETMVRQGFPMVRRPADVRYLDARIIAGKIWQKVMVTDANGTIHILDYNMIRDESGAWRINAVQILKAPQLGV